jgi:hypothetical protein
MSTFAIAMPSTFLTGGGGGGGGTSGGTFSNFKTITIDHTKVPNTDQSNFPVLVQGTYAYLAGVAYGGSVQDSNGHDIMFSSDSAGVNRLVFERVVYETATGTVEFRVRVPTVSHTTDTVFYIWYNNTVQTADLASANAWDSNFVGVYHFGDGVTLGRTDSTVKHNDNPTGNNGGSLPTVTSSGKILGGAAFAGGAGLLHRRRRVSVSERIHDQRVGVHRGLSDSGDSRLNG